MHRRTPTARRSPRLFASLALAAALPAPTVPAPAAQASAVSWGENVWLQLGARFKSPHETSPVPVAGLTDATALASGVSHGLALLRDGTVVAWGGNTSGQLGDGTRQGTWEKQRSPVQVAGLSEVRAIAAANAHSLALTRDGRVFAWGADQDGELGNGTSGNEREREEAGTPEGQLTPKLVAGLAGAVAIAAGGGSDYALLADGGVMAWGRDDAGQLGIGDAFAEICRTQVGVERCSTRPHPVLDEAGRPLTGVVAVSAGEGSAYALLADGHVVSWGANGRGQLGTGLAAGEETRFHPAREIPGLAGVSAISAGASHVLALLADGRVLGWGANADEELGATSAGACAKAPCDPTPQPIGSLKGVSAVSAGYQYSLALKGGRVLAWGRNEDGELGDGTTAAHGNPQPVPGLTGVTAVLAGDNHAGALLEEGAQAPPSPVALDCGVDSLAVSWSYAAPEYRLLYRLKEEGHFGQQVTISQTSEPQAFAAGDYVFASLAPQPYEVEVRSGQIRRKLLGTPTP